MPQLKVEWFSDRELTSARQTQIESLIQGFFPEHLVGGRYRFGIKPTNPHRLLIWDEDELVGHLLTVKRLVNLDGEKLKLLFVGELCVRQNHQGQGIGKQLMLALEPHLEPGYDLALLCCRAELLNFYQKSGWELLKVKVFFGPTESRSRCAEGIVVGRVLTPKARKVLIPEGVSLYLGEPI